MKNLCKKIFIHILCLVLILTYTVTTHSQKVVAGTSGYIAVSAGNTTTIALKNDGTVWSWGFNQNGHLGDGTTSNSNSPVQVKGLNGITAISAGWAHFVALKSDGTVWTWGVGYSGELGDGTNSLRTTPAPINGLTGITAISAGWNHTLALKADGTLWSWGQNQYGQLGTGNTTNSNIPLQVPGQIGITSISSGGGHSLVIKNDGTVWSWGCNNFGQLGNGTNSNNPTPHQISGLNGIINVSAGVIHSTALKSDGTVWNWGCNFRGELANGNKIDSYIPVQANGLNGIIAITAGWEFSSAIKSDGTFWVWGVNDYGQLGNGSKSDVTSPMQVSSLSGITAIDTGATYTVALKTDGNIFAFGENTYGQLGNGTTTGSTTPELVSIGDTYVATDKSALSIGYASGDSDTNVTQNLSLPTTTTNRSTITWSSSNPAIISDTGVVTRPTYTVGDTTVTLTATITKSLTTDTKTFQVNVIAKATDAESVMLDNTSLQIGYAPLDSSSNVTQNLLLPTIGANYTNITWTSTDYTLISSTGVVTRPSFTEGDATVILTATISKGLITATKVFNVTVTKQPPTDTESVALDKSSLKVGYAPSDSFDTVTQDVVLPTLGTNGTTITWNSSDSSVVSNGGTVTRPIYTNGDASITLTATITKGLVTDTKTFNITVIKNPITDYEEVALDKASLQIGYASGDNSNSVTQNLGLPTTSTNGTTITWSSSNPSLISASGLVIRPSYTNGDASITLTATITKGSISDIKTFNVTVIKNPITDAEEVALDKASLQIGYASGDNSNSVTQNLGLPTTSTNGTTITWSSSNPSLISASGLVIRPSYTNGDASITLTATITKGSISDIKNL
ncbi:immunoglobulin-like domain-containing protein [Clostridium cellulovorans]|uniref:Regulator of chromosome condensation RCC1 n=1 Tax=Clostridium cellulovorans (strain ATCC 35296 / DSM 3052 / OCM 3 / 743B) TaxID=573061 RepID=D9SV20_CLOC7|nr:immunoglobulin-like domain-containing protein [Clostridium cellulovorans]ADL52995.1 regulator of chromosome condensation RCC1 [Clostridium cellulovorans 743B]